MTPTTNQPTFWLEIKKEYIIQNFDSLFRYLKNYNYDEEAELAESDFNTTFKRLKEVVDDYLTQVNSSTLACPPHTLLEDDFPFVVKVIATYLLANKEKKGKDDLMVLSQLADLLLLDGQATTQSIKLRLKKLITSCMCGCKVIKLGYSWTNLDSGSGLYSVQTLCGMLSHTEFEETGQRKYIYEGKGFLEFSQDGLLIAPMSRTSYKVLASPNLMHIPFQLAIGSDVKLKYKKFEELNDLCKLLTEKQREVKPSPVKAPVKDYENGDEVYVEVYRKNAYELYARSTDKNRKKIEGRVKIEISKAYGLTNVINKYIEKDDCLLVQINPKAGYPFLLKDTFDDFYSYYLEEYKSQTCKAKFVRDYKGGMQYLTEHGFLINVPTNEETEDEQREARSTNRLVELIVSEVVKDAQKNTIASGIFYGVLEEIASSDYEDKARNQLVRGFVEESQPEEESYEEQCSISPFYIPMLAHSIYYMVQGVNETEERYKLLQAAYMLLTMTEDEQDARIVKFGMDYIHCLAQFAQGCDISTLHIPHDGTMELSDEMVQQLRIVESLRGYKTEPETTFSGPSISEKTEHRLKGLIDASNLLIGNINHVEIERIKKKISAELGVSDLYENGESGEYNYGEESDTLEFKTSLVYPPNNKMQPDLRTQRAHILKAVCGMLNSEDGGDVLLGVDDYGYATGLENDMKFLYKEKKIDGLTADKMRLYLSLQIDQAFLCEEDKEIGSHITGTRVSCNVDKSQTGKDVIRISVTPYEYGLVRLSDNEHIPEGFRLAAFLRRGGQTLRLDSDQCREVSEHKRKALDPDKQKFKELRKAMELKRMVILKNYQSKDSQRHDRHVEAYQPIEDRKSIICYDVERKELREFKTTRFESVEITEIPWRYTSRHHQLKIDAFDMLERRGEKPISIKLKLKPLAYNLLIEEYKQAVKDISDNHDTDSSDYPYLLKTKVFDIRGIGRFYIGLSQEIKIVDGLKLREYARQYVEDGDIFAP